MLGVSGGFNPALGLTSHLGQRPHWSDKACAFVPDQLPPGLDVAGAARGVFALAACLADGARAGEPPSVAAQRRHRRARRQRRQRRAGAAVAYAAQCAARRLSICRTTSPTADMVLAAREGFANSRASEALHHPGHGDRPGQDRRADRPGDHWPALTGRAAGRPVAAHRPAAGGAGGDRRLCRPSSRRAISARPG